MMCLHDGRMRCAIWNWTTQCKHESSRKRGPELAAGVDWLAGLSMSLHLSLSIMQQVPVYSRVFFTDTITSSLFPDLRR